MGMMHWADCQKSKRTDRYRQRMDMMPLETVHGKKKGIGVAFGNGQQPVTTNITWLH